jgi:hypothetical protein
MIKIPKLELENCDAFKIPEPSGADIFHFFQASETKEFESLRPSTFCSRKVFSFEKLKSYIHSKGGKVFLESNPKEQIYCISSCNLNELQSIIYGYSYPIFLQNYDNEIESILKSM